MIVIRVISFYWEIIVLFIVIWLGVILIGVVMLVRGDAFIVTGFGIIVSLL